MFESKHKYISVKDRDFYLVTTILLESMINFSKIYIYIYLKVKA